MIRSDAASCGKSNGSRASIPSEKAGGEVKQDGGRRRSKIAVDSPGGPGRTVLVNHMGVAELTILELSRPQRASRRQFGDRVPFQGLNLRPRLVAYDIRDDAAYQHPIHRATSAPSRSKQAIRDEVPPGLCWALATLRIAGVRWRLGLAFLRKPVDVARQQRVADRGFDPGASRDIPVYQAEEEIARRLLCTGKLR